MRALKLKKSSKAQIFTRSKGNKMSMKRRRNLVEGFQAFLESFRGVEQSEESTSRLVAGVSSSVSEVS